MNGPAELYAQVLVELDNIKAEQARMQMMIHQVQEEMHVALAGLADTTMTVDAAIAGQVAELVAEQEELTEVIAELAEQQEELTETVVATETEIVALSEEIEEQEEEAHEEVDLPGRREDTEGTEPGMDSGQPGHSGAGTTEVLELETTQEQDATRREPAPRTKYGFRRGGRGTTSRT